MFIQIFCLSIMLCSYATHPFQPYTSHDKEYVFLKELEQELSCIIFTHEQTDVEAQIVATQEYFTLKYRNHEFLELSLRCARVWIKSDYQHSLYCNKFLDFIRIHVYTAPLTQQENQLIKHLHRYVLRYIYDLRDQNLETLCDVQDFLKTARQENLYDTLPDEVFETLEKYGNKIIQNVQDPIESLLSELTLVQQTLNQVKILPPAKTYRQYQEQINRIKKEFLHNKIKVQSYEEALNAAIDLLEESFINFQEIGQIAQPKYNLIKKRIQYTLKFQQELRDIVTHFIRRDEEHIDRNNIVAQVAEYVEDNQILCPDYIPQEILSSLQETVVDAMLKDLIPSDNPSPKPGIIKFIEPNATPSPTAADV